MRPRLRTNLRLLLVSCLLTTASVSTTLAQTPDATPPGSAIVRENLPEGALGDQIAWVLTTIAPEAALPTSEEVTGHFDPTFLAQVPAEQFVGILQQLQAQTGGFTLVPDSLVVADDPSTTPTQFTIVAADGVTTLNVLITIAPDSGLITGLVFQPAAPITTPAATPSLSDAYQDEAITFTSGPDTLYGSLMSPADGEVTGIALIISGSGATDRNGNSPSLPQLDTNLNLATTLADAGIASFRYDKLGSGETGLASHQDGTGIDHELFLQEARDAAATLLAQPGFDVSSLILVGHSEGALFALVLASELTEAGTPPAAVILASPLSLRYLDLLDAQLSPQIDAAEQGGQLTPEEAATARTELAEIITSLRTTGSLPTTITTSVFQQVFSASNAAFLAQIDAVDPAELAASLPSTLPVLVLHGGKDQQVTADQVQRLMDGFTRADNANATLVSIPDANHLLKIVTGEPNASDDYRNPDLPFAPEAVTAITDFLADAGLTLPVATPVAD